MIVDGFFDHVPGSYVDQFPKLKAHNEAVQGCELIKAYKEAYGEKAYIWSVLLY